MNVLVTARLLIILCCSAGLAACATPGSNLIPAGGQRTMPQLYQSETGAALTTNFNNQVNAPSRVALTRELPRSRYVAQTAHGKREVDSLFKPLPNPEIPV